MTAAQQMLMMLAVSGVFFGFTVAAYEFTKSNFRKFTPTTPVNRETHGIEKNFEPANAAHGVDAAAAAAKIAKDVEHAKRIAHIRVELAKGGF